MKKLFAKKWVQNVVWVVAAAVIFFGMRAYQKRDVLAADGRPVPAFKLQSLDGTLYDLQGQQGKRVVLFFFAPWCSVCKRNVSTLTDLRQDYQEDDVLIVAVGLGYRNVKELESFRDKYEVTFPVLVGNEAVQQQFGISSFPTTFLVDAAGRLSDSFLGYTPLLALKWGLW